MRRLLMATTVLGLACGSSEPDSKGSGNTLGDDNPECRETSSTAVTWTDPTGLGIPSALFSQFAGTCQAPFQWDARGWSDVTVLPVRGQSTVTATVVLNQASARWVTRTPTSCGDLLQVDGTVTLELPEGEGMVANQRPVTLSTSRDTAPTVLSFALPEADFGPWVTLQKADPTATLSMSVQLGAPARACSGQIMLTYQRSANGIGMATGGPFATWSDGPCPVGQEKVDLTQPWQGVEVASAITSSFGQVTLSGAWNDGTATTLSLTTTLPSAVACAETRTNGANTVIVPVDLVANTADGRVRALSGRGTIRVTSNQGSLIDQQLWLSIDLACASPADSLAYTGASCATIAKVTAQLGVNRYTINSTSNGGHLALYLYNREGNGTGAAGRVDTFQFGP